jgi:hypothetical protein
MSDNRTQNNKPARDSNPAQTAASATQRSMEAAEQHSRAAAEAVRQGGHAAAELSSRAGESGAEVLRRSTEAVAKTQRQMAQDAAERLNVVSRGVAEATRETTEDIRTLMSLPSVADRGMRDLQQTFAGLVDAVVQTNLRATEELVRLANPISFLELQQRFVTDHMNVVMEGSAAFARAMRQTVDQSLPVLEQRLGERQRTRADHPAQTTRAFQTAAE